jgi:hypothetical protein
MAIALAAAVIIALFCGVVLAITSGYVSQEGTPVDGF